MVKALLGHSPGPAMEPPQVYVPSWADALRWEIQKYGQSPLPSKPYKGEIMQPGTLMPSDTGEGIPSNGIHWNVGI